MTAKEYLSQLDKINYIIKQKRLDAESIRDSITSIGGLDSSERVQSSRVESDAKFVNSLIKLDEIQGEIAQQIKQYESIKLSMVEDINTLDNIVHIQILRMRYVDGQSFEDIAIGMRYTYRHVIKLHGLALREFSIKHKNKLGTKYH